MRKRSKREKCGKHKLLTKAQFAVGYDGTISLTTGQPCQPGGTEMTTPYSGDRPYTG